MKYLLKCALSKKNINENAPLPSNCSRTNATNEEKKCENCDIPFHGLIVIIIFVTF